MKNEKRITRNQDLQGNRDWLVQTNKTTNLYEDGELPKEALDKKTNLTYILTEAKINTGVSE